MTLSIDKPNWVNEIGTFQSEGRTSVRSRPSQAVKLERNFVDLRVCSVNVGTLRG